MYPAYFISRFNPINSVKGSYKGKPSKNYLRITLVITQFSNSIALMIGVLIIIQKLKYIRDKNLGFHKNNILFIKARPEISSKFETFKEELLQNPSIINASATSNIPGKQFYTYRFVPEGKTIENPIVLPLLNVEYDFLKTLSIKIKNGRGFSKQHPSDSTTAFIVNQAALRELGWEKNPLGKKISLFAAGTNEIERSGKVIGVIDDVIYESLHQTVKPMVLILGGYTESYIIKYDKGNVNEIINYTHKVWDKFVPKWPMEYSFLSNNLLKNYKSENNMESIVNYFTIFAFFIACLGLFGLTAFIVEQKTKEIGIRKVLGANIAGLTYTLSKQFILWVLLANLAAWPFAFYFMNKWLDNFAYRIEMQYWVFFVSTIVALIIALLTVSTRAVKAATANPAKSLRYE